VPFKIFFQDEALEDIQDAYHWYEGQLTNLGEEFLKELNKVLDKLEKTPQYYSYSFDEFRDVRLKRFPYLVLYKIDGNKVYINSVRHVSRRPKF
jgi:toxin ParE1/3/4